MSFVSGAAAAPRAGCFSVKASFLSPSQSLLMVSIWERKILVIMWQRIRKELTSRLPLFQATLTGTFSNRFLLGQSVQCQVCDKPFRKLVIKWLKEKPFPPFFSALFTERRVSIRVISLEIICLSIRWEFPVFQIDHLGAMPRKDEIHDFYLRKRLKPPGFGSV